MISPDTAFTEEGGTSHIKYREDFNQYKAFLVKYAETDAIKLLVNKLNADILQIYNNEPQDCTPFSIPQVGEEDLVAQGLLNIRSMILHARITSYQFLTL